MRLQSKFINHSGMSVDDYGASGDNDSEDKDDKNVLMG